MDQVPNPEPQYVVTKKVRVAVECGSVEEAKTLATKLLLRDLAAAVVSEEYFDVTKDGKKFGSSIVTSRTNYKMKT